MGPDQHSLYNDERAGIDHVFAAQQRLHQRNDQRPGVAVDGVHLLHRIQLQRTVQQRRHCQQHDMHGCSNDHGVHKSSPDGRRILDLKCVQDHAGAHKVHHEHRDHFTVAGLQQACFYDHITHEQDQKQLRDLLRQQ